MRKYIAAFLITIPILLIAWYMVDSAEEQKNTYNGIVEENAGDQTGILQETDADEMIIPEEPEAIGEEPDIISASWYPYFLEQQEYISYISNGQCSYEIIGEEECEITLYNKEHVKVFSEVYPLHHSWVEAISDNILEIGLSVGSPARYTFYFDTQTAEMSDVFFNGKVFGDKYIAYMDDDVIGADEITLTLTDIFERGILHQEVVRDFSVCADPMSAVHSVEMIDDNSIRLEYCKGEDYTTVSEIIELEWTSLFYGEASADDVYGVENTAGMMIETINEALLTQKIKEHLQNNDFSEFTFMESEKALCYYMGTSHDYPNMYAFAVCREALNGDIVHERTIYIAKETGHSYAKDNGTLVELNMAVPKGMQLPDVTRNSAWNWEPEWVYGEDGTNRQMACGEDGEKVLDQMLDFIKKEKVIEQKGVSGDWGVIYYGECTYFYRRYHEVNLVEEHHMHVVTLKRYYIDALSGNVYEEPYESIIGMDSDIALHFIGKIEIGEESADEAESP